jgi:spermidine synthase
MIRVIVRTYLSVFPDARAFMAAYNVDTPLLGLMSGGVWPPPPDWWATRVGEPGLASALELVAMRDELSLIGTFVGDAAALRAFVGEGEINTDDRPVVIYSAPRFAYRADEPPHARLMRLLERVRPDGAALVVADDPGWKRVLSRRYELYFSARDLYLKAAVADRAGSRSAAIDLYLESVRTSREFPTSQAVLRQFIAELSATDRAASEALSKRLDEAMARK